MEKFIIETIPYGDEKLYKKKTINLKKGLTVLVGPNGSGKSTLIKLLKEELRKQNIKFFSFDNYNEGGSRILSELSFKEDFETMAAMLSSSEGQRISETLRVRAPEIGYFVRKNSDSEKLFFFFDAVDSGYDIGNIISLKEDLFDTIIEDCRSKGIEAYIICSTNSYELANGEQCFDIREGKYSTFENYDEYRDFILETEKKIREARKDG